MRDRRRAERTGVEPWTRGPSAPFAQLANLLKRKTAVWPTTSRRLGPAIHMATSLRSVLL